MFVAVIRQSINIFGLAALLSLIGCFKTTTFVKFGTILYSSRSICVRLCIVAYIRLGCTPSSSFKFVAGAHRLWRLTAASALAQPLTCLRLCLYKHLYPSPHNCPNTSVSPKNTYDRCPNSIALEPVFTLSPVLVVLLRAATQQAVDT